MTTIRQFELCIRVAISSMPLLHDLDKSFTALRDHSLRAALLKARSVTHLCLCSEAPGNLLLSSKYPNPRHRKP